VGPFRSTPLQQECPVEPAARRDPRPLRPRNTALVARTTSSANRHPHPNVRRIQGRIGRPSGDCAEVTRALRVLPLRSLHSAHLAWRQSHPDHSIARALRHRRGIIQLRAVRISTRRPKLLAQRRMSAAAVAAGRLPTARVTWTRGSVRQTLADIAPNCAVLNQYLAC